MDAIAKENVEQIWEHEISFDIVDLLARPHFGADCGESKYGQK
jgi:hypothetical protein